MEYEQKCDLKKDTCILDCLKGFHDALSSNWEATNEKVLCTVLRNLKELLELLSRDTQSVDERLEQCQCSDKTFCCYVGISWLCCLLLNDLVSHEYIISLLKSEAELSMQQRQHMSTLLQFVLSHGLLPSLGFSISIVIPKSNLKCSSADKDLLVFSRCLLSLCDEDSLRNLLLPRHQVSIMAALLQVVYSSDFKKNMTCAEYQFYERALKKLITTWSKLEDVARCLLVLQGSESRSAPSWLRKACGRLLSACLIRENGLYSVILALLATLGEQMSDWKKVEVVTRILSTPPHQRKKEEYFGNICDQACRLLRPHPNCIRDDSDKTLLHVLTCTILDMYKTSPHVVHRCFFNKVFLPFNTLYFDDEAKSATEEPFGLTSALETLHNIFVVFKHPQREDATMKLIVPHLIAIFAAFTFARQHISHLQSVLREIVIETLKLFEDEDAANVVLCICGVPIDKPCEVTDSIKIIKDVDFHFDDDQELLVTSAHRNSLDCVIAEQDETVRAILDLLSHYKPLTTPVLVQLIKRLGGIDEDADEANHLYSGEEQEIVRFRRHKGRLLIFAMLSAICEDTDVSELLSDGENICNLMKVVMQKASLPTVNSAQEPINCDSLKTCFALLGLFLLKQPTLNQLSKMFDLVPLLRKISTLPHLGATERESAADIALAIATHDPSSCLPPHHPQELFNHFPQAVHPSAGGESCQLPNNSGKPRRKVAKNVTKHKEFQANKKLVRNDDELVCNNDELVRNDDELVRNDDKLVCNDDKLVRNDDELVRNDNKLVCNDDKLVRNDDKLVRNDDKLVRNDDEVVRNHDELGQKNCHQYADNTSLPTHHEAIDSIYDPSPPTRAAGFRFIAASIPNGKMKATDELCNLLMEVLIKEADAFVYLSAIQALVECIDRLPARHPTTESSFQRLVQEYDDRIRSPGGATEAAVLKIGEVIMRMVGKLGDFVDIQTRFLVAVLFRASRDPRPPIRSSALSNLAQISTLLPHRLPSFQHELSECLCATTESDDDATVRRAAVHAIRSLIEHLGPDILQIFPDTMTTFYSTLKRAYSSDVDNVVQLHAQLAVEALDVIMRDVIFNEPVRRSKAPNKQIVFLS